MLIRFICKLFTLRVYNLVTDTWNLRLFRKLFRNLALDLGLTSNDVEYVTNRSLSEGTPVFTTLLPKLGKAFDRALADGYLSIPLGFKTFTKRKVPHFLGSLFCKVFDCRGNLRDDPDVSAVRAIRQVCYFFYKAPLPHSWEQEKEVAGRFISNEDDLHRRTKKNFQGALDWCKGDSSQWARDVVIRAVVIVNRLFGDIDFSAIRPKHSSGSVVGGLNVLQKYAFPKDSKKPWSTLGRFISPFFEKALDDSAYPVWSHVDVFSTKHGSSDKSEVLFVPKDSRGPRLICREPKDYQYLQQGFKDYAMRVIETHPLTSGQVNFASQEINREMSKFGSITRAWSTLDLKDASDRNSLSLVRLIWSGCPQALAYLEASRTAYTVVHGRTLELAKFAPMGSALCFPVMALNIFALLAGAYACQEGIPIELASKSIYVYGDDIVVPTAFAKLAMYVLEHFGFKVNNDKSFVFSYFTESCGSDWFKGNLVTPVRLRCQAISNNQNIVKAVMTARNLSRQGLHRTADCLYTLAERLLGPLPYGSDTCSYLARWTLPESVSSSNFQLRVGSRMLKGWTICPTRRHGHEAGYGRLERTLPQIGLTDVEIPQFGEYTPPRRFTLRKKRVLMA